MHTNSSVLIIVINYKCSDLISYLVRSINEEHLELNILILDNESTDESYCELSKIEDNRIILLRSESNLGFTGGLNFALDFAAAKLGNFNYFFLLNPDAVCHPHIISGLISEMESDRSFACISPQIVDSFGELWYSGAKINATHGKVINNFFYKQGDCSTSGLTRVDVFSGCAALFDYKVFKTVGHFNEMLFMYYDEAEYSIRMARKGLKIGYSSKYSITHNVSSTTKGFSFIKTYYMARNKLIVFHKTMTPFRTLYFILFELAYQLKKGRWLNAKYHLKGIFDFYRGYSGPLSRVSRQ